MMDNDIISRLTVIDHRLTAIEELLSATHAASFDPSDTTGISKGSESAASRPLSATEYIMQKQPADDNQRTLVLASYLETYGRQRDFTADELRQAFKDSRLKLPSNVNDKIGKRVKKGELMAVGERDGKKTWQLTMTGQGVVEKGFGK